MTETEFTVFIVDDDEDIRAALSRSLGKRGYQVEAHASAVSFLDSFRDRRSGCLILDYGMPGMNGLELQAHLNMQGLTLPIIFITGHGGVPESVQAMKGGAVDFLEKPFRQVVLVERIEAVFATLRNEKDQDMIRTHTVARFARLTTRETEIVARILSHPAAVSSKDIAQYLGISPRTVDHHRARIFEKLDVQSMAELVTLARVAMG